MTQEYSVRGEDVQTGQKIRRGVEFLTVESCKQVGDLIRFVLRYDSESLARGGETEPMSVDLEQSVNIVKKGKE